MATKTFAFDAAELLDSPEAQAAYLSEIMAHGDAGAVAEALGTIARARHDCRRARGWVWRKSLYRALNGEGNSEFGTILKVLGALGPGLSVTAKNPA
jgi:probable addiction module antidote protein